MRLEELIGRPVMRIYQAGEDDFSYMNPTLLNYWIMDSIIDGCKIMICKTNKSDTSLLSKNGYGFILSPEYDDDSWIDATNVLNRMKEIDCNLASTKPGFVNPV